MNEGISFPEGLFAKVFSTEYMHESGLYAKLTQAVAQFPREFYEVFTVSFSNLNAVQLGVERAALEALPDPDTLPPPIVYIDDDGAWLVDGHKRVLKRYLRGETQCRCVVLNRILFEGLY